MAWRAYKDSKKSPVTRKAGSGFADPDYDLSVDWIAARQAVLDARERYEDDSAAPRILIVNGSSRSEHNCPGEMSKTTAWSKPPGTRSKPKPGFRLKS